MITIKETRRLIRGRLDSTLKCRFIDGIGYGLLALGIILALVSLVYDDAVNPLFIIGCCILAGDMVSMIIASYKREIEVDKIVDTLVNDYNYEKLDEILKNIKEE